MTTKRTPINRSRKPSNLIDSEAVKLFARLEHVPVRHRMGRAYRGHALALARRLGLSSEHWLDAHQLNDPELFRRLPKYDCFRESWEKVLATRKQLLTLAGLAPDSSNAVAPYDTDYDYDDSGDFDDLAPPSAKRSSRRKAAASADPRARRPAARAGARAD
jgi:hypothetical protein